MSIRSIITFFLLIGSVVAQDEPSHEPTKAAELPKNEESKELIKKIKDIGQESIGELKVTLIYATNGDVTKAGPHAKKVRKKRLIALKKLKKINFKHYRILGEDRQPILRSYENWANPLKGRKEILLSFQPRGIEEDKLILDIEFWQSQKKIMKGGVPLSLGKPLYIQGPTWRGGTLIIAVEMVKLGDKQVIESKAAQ